MAFLMLLWGKYALAAIFFSLAAITYPQPDQNYSDPLLLNGKIYIFHPLPGTEGHQFLDQREFTSGRLKLKDVEYKDVLLNYDIYNQQLLLRYTESSGASNLIVVSDAWIEEFTISNRNFKAISLSDSIKRFFQVIGEDSIKVLYAWRKSLGLSHVHGATNYVFSKPVRTMHMYLNNRIYQYRNNKSFYKLFDPDKASKIRDYLKSNRINVRNADDSRISALVDFCNSI